MSLWGKVSWRRHGLSAVIIILCSMASSDAFAFWSFGPVSTHEQISEKSIDLVQPNLSDPAFSAFIADNKHLLFKQDLVDYASTFANDIGAHGEDGTRNGGDISKWYNSFKLAFLNEHTDMSLRWLGYCMHLIQDMGVPAHALNIPHAGQETVDPLFGLNFDNFEMVAAEIYNTYSPIDISRIYETDYPDSPLAYYSLAREQTISNISRFGLGSYWHTNESADQWCGDNDKVCAYVTDKDGKRGYYINPEPTQDEDAFPSTAGALSDDVAIFLAAQVADSARNTGRFLLSVDRTITSSSAAVDQCAFLDEAAEAVQIPCISLENTSYWVTLSFEKQRFSVAGAYVNRLPINQSQCANFDASTNIVHLPCFKYGADSLWVDLSLVNADPILLEIKSYGVNHACAPPAFDLSGSWDYMETIDSNSCRIEGSYADTMTISQSGNILAMTSPNRSFTLELCGDIISYEGGSYTYNGGTLTFTPVTVTVASAFTLGWNVPFSWTDGSSSCSGSVSFVLTKQGGDSITERKGL